MTRLLNLKLIAKVMSINLFVLGSAFLVCTGIAELYDEDVFPFVFSFLITLSLATVLLTYSKNRNDDDDIQRKDAYLLVTTSWVLFGLIGALPYIFSGSIPSFVNATFESVSGFTTTGSSILTDIEALPKSILFWRSLTHWIGGIGIIILVIIILPSLKIGGYHLFTLESSLQDKIKPRIRQVGYRLLWIYISLTAAETILLVLGGMDLYDSVCHAFGTIATGGFSPKNTSIGGYSPYIQYVVMAFMLLAGTNFVIHYYLIKREFTRIKENEEFRFYYKVIFVLGLIAALTLIIVQHKPIELAFREGFFQVVSIVTCTGFATADYLLWPEFAWILIFFAMFLGGSTGSTAGGIKMARHLILFKNLKNAFRQLLHPHAVIPVRFNNRTLPEQANHFALTFIGFYLLVFIFGSLLLAATGVDGETASSSVATCMAGIGPGIGSVGPASNFAHIPVLGKILLTILMIFGRLEIYPVVILFTRNFWAR